MILLTFESSSSALAPSISCSEGEVRARLGALQVQILALSSNSFSVIH